jgi:hypothetical protein
MSGEDFAQVTLNRFTTTHDRFQVVSSVCGWLAGYSKFVDALSYARAKKTERHTEPQEIVTIFDLMAHHGKPQLWDIAGKILARKP